MSTKQTGLVVGKDFRPPPGSAPLYWCYLTVDLSDDERITVRINPDQVHKADVGDVVRFRKPLLDKRAVKRVVRLSSRPSWLPPVTRQE